jgi:hypothetical protein
LRHQAGPRRHLTIPDAHLGVLRLLCAELPPEQVNWALTGSVGHRLQGVDIAVHDIDIQTDEAGAWRIDDVLHEHTVEPARQRVSDLISSIFGVYRIGDIQVELMGRLQKRPNPDHPWGLPTDPAEHALVVNFDGLLVPVLSLAYEAIAYEALGRTDRARLLRAALGRPEPGCSE